MKWLKHVSRKAKNKIATDNERGARTSLIEELFFDFHRSKTQVYTMNFVRGVFFGAGSVVGGTLVIALFVWLLSLLSVVLPPLGDFFDGISNAIEAGKR